MRRRQRVRQDHDRRVCPGKVSGGRGKNRPNGQAQVFAKKRIDDIRIMPSMTYVLLLSE
jgi:hypothetical protein